MPDRWESNTAFLFAAIGAAIGIGNILRFPSVSFRHGGATFLIPYFVALLLVGLPVLGLELMLGQHMRKVRGAIACTAGIYPNGWGIGALAVFASFWILAYYNVIMAWVWCYLYHSLSSELPWGTTLEETTSFFRATISNDEENVDACNQNPALHISTLHWPVAAGLAIQYLVLFFALWKGKKLLSKIVLVTMPGPWLLLVLILGYALSLEGAFDGVRAYLIDVDLSLLSRNGFRAWVDACAQIFFSLGLAVGGMVAYGSGQPPGRRVVANVWIVGLSNSLFSLIAGMAVFAVLGFLTHGRGDLYPGGVRGLCDAEVGGYRLAFVSIPAALARLPHGVAQLVSVGFYVMLLLLGLDSSMVLVESVTAALQDCCTVSAAVTDNSGGRETPRVSIDPSEPPHAGVDTDNDDTHDSEDDEDDGQGPAFFVLLVCVVGFLIGLILCTDGGSTLIDILDHFLSTYCVLLAGFLECLLVGFGFDLVAQDKSSYPESDVLGPEPMPRGLHKDATRWSSDGEFVEVDLEANPETDPQPILAPAPSTPHPHLHTRIYNAFFSSRLEREIAAATGQSPFWLPVCWSFCVKVISPIFILIVFVLNVLEDAHQAYGGYPTWANAVFGWLVCVCVPLTMLVISVLVPYDQMSWCKCGMRRRDQHASRQDRRRRNCGDTCRTPPVRRTMSSGRP